MALELVTWPDDRLQQRCRPVTAGELAEARGDAELIEAFLLDHEGAAGIAAPQLGVMRRVLSARMQDGRVLTMLNPTVFWLSAAKATEPEGCLSLPGEVWEVERALQVRVRWADKRGGRHDHEFGGWEARVVQHEVDHLNGVLIRDAGQRVVDCTQEQGCASPLHLFDCPERSTT